MNNWRLLFLALVAVFQPITSFTERSLVDGRQQCCDRRTDTLLRDSRPNLYETNRLAKPSSSLRRLNYRDAIRQDRQLSQRVVLFSSRSTERSLENIQERNLRQNPLITSRSSRVDYHRVVTDDDYERQPDDLRKERNTLTRLSIMQRNDRTNEFLSRYSETRDGSRINRLSNQRQDREMQRNDRTNELLSRKSQTRDESQINRLSNERQDREMQRNVRNNELLSRNSQSRDESRINRLSNERQDREMQRNVRNNELRSRISQSRVDRRINRLSNERPDREMQRNDGTNEIFSRTPQSRGGRQINRVSNGRQDREMQRNARTYELLMRNSQSRDERRISRASTERRGREIQRNVRTNELLSRNSQFSDESRMNRLSNERQDREISRTEQMELRTETFHRMLSTRASREGIWMTRVVEDRHESHRTILGRERATVMLREPANERREQERQVKQRRSLSENSNVVSRVRDMRINFRDQNRENRERSVVRLQHNNDRLNSRVSVKEKTDFKDSDDTIVSDRRDIRDSTRCMKNRNVRNSFVENRRDMRLTSRLSKEIDDQFVRESRVESRASRRMAERDSRVTDLRAHSRSINNFRDARSDSKFSRNDNTLRESDDFRRLTAHRSTMDSDAVNNRFRNVESARARDNSIMIHKPETEIQLIGNWQYIFYSIQAAYICGLIIQMLTTNRHEKSKIRNLHWWPLASQRLIKME